MAHGDLTDEQWADLERVLPRPGDPDHGEDHQAITTDTPAGIARTLTTWLATRG